MCWCDEVRADRTGVDEEGLDSCPYIDVSILVIVVVESPSPIRRSF